MPDIVISEFMDEAALEAHLGGMSCRYDPALVDRRDELLASLAAARALIVRNRTQVDAALLDAAPRLEIVGRLGVGLDNIDLAACRARDVIVQPATGANDRAVAEYVIAAAMVLLRGAFGARDSVRGGDWPRNALIGRETADRCLGLVGFGAIARETAARARALGMRIAAFDPYVPAGDPAWETATRHETLDGLLAVADVLSLHVPLTSETRNLIDMQALAKLPSGAVVINAARGGILDEPALAEALRAGHLGGAALDVFADEPLSAEAGAVFDGLENILLTPHIAGVTEESNRRVSAMIAKAVRDRLTRTESGRHAGHPDRTD